MQKEQLIRFRPIKPCPNSKDCYKCRYREMCIPFNDYLDLIKFIESIKRITGQPDDEVMN
jgi:hypothetical protein